MSVACNSCMVLHFENSVLKTDLHVKTEELTILRTAQQDCAKMASEIHELHVLVDEQRRHLIQSSYDKAKVDPDIGVFTWLDQLSTRQKSMLAELKAEKDKEVASLQLSMGHQNAVLLHQLNTVTAQYQEAMEQVTNLHAMVNLKTAQVEQLEACVVEQRRHLASLKPEHHADPDVGLLPLVRKGFFESSEDMVRMVQAATTAATSKLQQQVDAELHAFERVKDNLVAALDARQEELKLRDKQLAVLTEENLTLAQQVNRTRDFLNEWKRKYEEKCEECEALLLANEVRLEEESYAVRVAELTAEKMALEEQKEVLEKSRDAAVAGVRHWQKEAGNITTDLVAALANRDGIQLQLYTVCAEKQALEDELAKFKKVVESQKKACEFVSDVMVLTQRYMDSAEKTTISSDELETMLLEEEEQSNKDGKSGKKKKNKKRK